MQKGEVAEGGCPCNSADSGTGLPFENMTDFAIDDNQRVFLTQLKEAVTNGGTKNLWKKHGNRVTMQFKDRNLEAKVCIFLNCHCLK